ncbi:MAG: hypothetical protein AAF611_03410 [Bacteroidota bacterium]
MKKIILFAFIGITLLSCSSDDTTANTTSIDYTQYITQNEISSNIHFMPEETFADLNMAPQVPDLQLKLSTEEIYPCINYNLISSEFVVGNELIVRFDEVVEPEVCLTALGPAISYIDVPENISFLTLLNGNTIDRYTIEITTEKVIITLIETNFTLSLHENTFRIPENSFAFVCGTTEDTTQIYDDFSTILDQNPDFTEFQFEGEGRIPYPEVSSGHWVNHPSKYYRYTNPTAFSDLATTINNYAAQNLQNASGTSFSIYGWNNVSYYSWIDN